MTGLAGQVLEFVDQHLDVELTDHQERLIRDLYGHGDPGALARPGV